MNFSEFEIPDPVLELIRTLKTNSFQGWIVGGAVRTMLLNKTPHDWDVTTDAKPDEVSKIFPHAIETGVMYGTVTVILDDLPIQVTTFRKESEYENFRKPKDVHYVQNILDDLSRRDFTMNAIAYDPIDQRVEDPFGGVDDIEQQWIKAVGDANVRFQEDALRILRAIRFESQLGFFIEENTRTSMSTHSSLIQKLSHERIQTELSKWLVGEYFSMTRVTAFKMNLFQIFDIHPSKRLHELWDIISIFPTLTFRLCAFLDLYFGDFDLAEKLTNSLKLLKTLKFPQNTISKVVQFIDFLAQDIDLESRENRMLWLKKALDIGFEDSICLLDWKILESNHNLLYLKAKAHLVHLKVHNYEHRVRPLAINGDEIMKILGVGPGAHIRSILQDLEDKVLENPELNTLESLSDLLKKSD